jgi:hypothetical protein
MINCNIHHIYFINNYDKERKLTYKYYNRNSLFDYPIKNLPCTIKSIVFSDNLFANIEFNELPESITHLTIGHQFKKQIN